MQRELFVENIGGDVKHPTPASRKHGKVQFLKSGNKITVFVPSDGCLNFTDKDNGVLLAGFGRKGQALGDIAGVWFKAVRAASVSLLALYKGKKGRSKPYILTSEILINLHILGEKGKKRN